MGESSSAMHCTSQNVKAKVKLLIRETLEFRAIKMQHTCYLLNGSICPKLLSRTFCYFSSSCLVDFHSWLSTLFSLFLFKSFQICDWLKLFFSPFRTGSKLGISPLMLAAMNGHTAAVKLLLDMGSDINAQIETNRNTALTLACFQGRTEVVSLLLDRKANVEHRAKVRSKYTFRKICLKVLTSLWSSDDSLVFYACPLEVNRTGQVHISHSSIQYFWHWQKDNVTIMAVFEDLLFLCIYSSLKEKQFFWSLISSSGAYKPKTSNPLTWKKHKNLIQKVKILDLGGYAHGLICLAASIHSGNRIEMEICVSVSLSVDPSSWNCREDCLVEKLLEYWKLN